MKKLLFLMTNYISFSWLWKDEEGKEKENAQE